MRHKTKTLGNHDSTTRYDTLARNFLHSAKNNFMNIRKRHARADSCGLIEHYTDVVAEAVTAEAVAFEAGNKSLAEDARRMATTATHAQRGAVKACSLGKKRR